MVPTKKPQTLQLASTIKIKGPGNSNGTCAQNGVPYRCLILREEAISSTVSTDNLLTTALIAAHQCRTILGFDVLEVDPKVDAPNNALRMLKIEGNHDNITHGVNMECKTYERMEHGVEDLHIRMVKASHVMIESTLL